MFNTTGGFVMKKLHVNVACGKNSLETVWALLTPKSPGGKYKHYICCCLYSTPKSKLNEALLHHIQFNVTRLTDLYKDAGVIICGDINNLKVDRLLNVYANLKNLVADPTHGSKILDVILTDAHAVYDRAKVGPAIGPDVAVYGKASDHLVAIACLEPGKV